MLGRAAQARSASRWIESETMRKHGTELYCFIRGAEGPRYFLYHARARNPKPLVLAAFFPSFLSLVKEREPPEAFSGTRSAAQRCIPQSRLLPCQPPLGKGDEGRGMRIATTSLRTGLAMTPFTRGAVQHRWADRGVRPYKNADDLARAGGVEPRPYAAYGV